LDAADEQIANAQEAFNLIAEQTTVIEVEWETKKAAAEETE
jgi:hypothetical protein